MAKKERWNHGRWANAKEIPSNRTKYGETDDERKRLNLLEYLLVRGWERRGQYIGRKWRRQYIMRISRRPGGPCYSTEAVGIGDTLMGGL